METELEHILMHSYKKEAVAYLRAHPEDFEEAVQLALSDISPLCWRSAFLLWSVMEQDDQRMKPYLGSIIAGISSKQDGHQRELVKILLQMEIPVKLEGILFDSCTTIWLRIQANPSVRFTAFRCLLKLAGKHKELQREIRLLAEEQYLEPFSAVAVKSIKRMIQQTFHAD